MQVLHLAVYLRHEDIDRIGHSLALCQRTIDRILADIGSQATSVPIFLHCEDGSCKTGRLHYWDASGYWTFEEEPQSSTSPDDMDRAGGQSPAIFA